jgi:hypothetical protein
VGLGNVTNESKATMFSSPTFTGTVTISAGVINTDNIRVAGNRIETTSSNSNLELNTVGTGSINLLADTSITGNVTLSNQPTIANHATTKTYVDTKVSTLGIAYAVALGS